MSKLRPERVDVLYVMFFAEETSLIREFMSILVNKTADPYMDTSDQARILVHLISDFISMLSTWQAAETSNELRSAKQ